MSAARPHRFAAPHAARGAAVIEFAFVVMVFLLLIIGIAEFGRWLFTLNAASEATRYGARVAAVCDVGSAGVPNRMREFLPDLQDGQVTVQYFRATGLGGADWSAGACTVETCTAVRVRLQGYSIPGIAWFLPADLAIPDFSTTLMRESLRSAIDGSANTLCN